MRVIVYGFGNGEGYGALLDVDQATGAPISERKRRLLYDAITYVFHWSYTNDAWDRRMEELSDDGATSDDGQELDFDFLVGDTREVKVWPWLIKGCVEAKNFHGSFFDVSTATIARKDAFFSIFQNL